MVDGHGLRMTSVVVRSAAEMLTMVERWQATMRQNGWN